MFSKALIAEKLPLKVMEKGASVEIMAVVHMGSRSKEQILLRWDDGSGSNRAKEIEVTL